MSRIFTTRFSYNHQLYTAMVTVVTKNDQLNFNVRLLDSTLHQLIPQGTIAYEGWEGYRQVPGAENNTIQSLLQCIAKAIEHYLTTQPQVTPVA